MDKKNQNDENDPDDERDSTAQAGAKTPAKRSEPPRKSPPPAPSAAGSSEPGFFHIYKKGQGKWTRMGTVLGGALVGAMTATFVYNQTNYRTIYNFELGYIPCLVFCALYALLCYILMNNHTNVDFLIATDSEMKKVNWTTRAELWGSTKVIIIFMFIIAIFLFVVDELFEVFFYLIHVLQVRPW